MSTVSFRFESGDTARVTSGVSIFYVRRPPAWTKGPTGTIVHLSMPTAGQLVSTEELRALADALDELFGTKIPPGQAEGPTCENYGGTD
jgi:hypothetical protein